jgi:O-methyltransferase
VDCDLYSSSKEVFEFIEPLAITGTWLLLDDYWLYRGHPDHGQRKAFDEWMRSSKRLGYSDYANFNGYGKAVILYEK